MRKFLFLLLITLLITNPIFSDSAPMQVAQGGTVRPFNSPDIVLRDELIDMQLFKNYCLVNVGYTFVNTGPEQTIIMGFPNFPTQEGDGVLPIESFQAFENQQKLPTFRQQDSSNKPEGLRKNYECFRVSFKPGEIKKITNSYRQEYQDHYKASYHTVNYILSTGSLWKGLIASVKVNVTLNGFPPPELLGRIVYLDKRQSYGAISSEKWPGFEIKPGQWLINGNRYSTQFINIEPDFNVSISLPDFLVSEIKAGSELKSADQRYAPWNVYDNNSATAWVEGVSGPGIGQTLSFDLNPWYHDTSSGYLVEQIGIINGYAKNQELFQANNRVKRLRIASVALFDYYGVSANGSAATDRTTLDFLLADTMEMQYIKFPKPLFMSELTLTILEVYPGAKYDDTCISEVHIFPAR
jgi:hypothetical protein